MPDHPDASGAVRIVQLIPFGLVMTLVEPATGETKIPSSGDQQIEMLPAAALVFENDQVVPPAAETAI
jgi:hypothetical protein